MKRFTIRVYGLLMNDQQEVLLVHEKMPSMHFTKFPGGGLEFGEGTRACLAREFKEETGLQVEVSDHLYTTDYFQPSLFNPDDQLMAIYYQVKTVDPLHLIPQEEIVINVGGKQEILRFFWHPLNERLHEVLTFPVDRLLAQQLLGGELTLR